MNPFESLSPRTYSKLTQAGQLEAFVANADRAWDLVDLHCREWLQHEPLAAGIGSDICHALIHASISSLASQLSPELLSESVRRDIWPLEQALFFGRHLPDLHHRVSALTALASLTADSDRARIVEEIAAEIDQVESLPINFDLARLAATVTDLGFAKEALQLARSHGSHNLARILISVSRHLVEPLRSEILLEAFEVARRSDSRDRAHCLAELVPYLQEPFRAQAIDEGMKAAAKIELVGEKGFDAVRQIWALASFVPWLGSSERGDVLADILKRVEIREDAATRSRALTECLAACTEFLSEPLKRSLREDALTAARAVADVHDRLSLLARLLPYLAEPHRTTALEEALDGVSQIRLPDKRMQLLAALAPHLPATLARECAASLKEHPEGWSVGWALSEIAVRLSRLGNHEEALATVRTIHDAEHRRTTLAQLASVLPTPVLADALLLSNIGDDAERRRALIGLAAYLEEDEHREALRNLRLLPDAHPFTYGKTDALADLVESLHPSLLADAVRLVTELPERMLGPSPRLAGLVALMPRLITFGHLTQATMLALSFKNDALRVEALAHLIPALAQPDRQAAVDEALDALALIKRQPQYVAALVHLAARCDGTLKHLLVSEGMEAVARIRQPYDRAQALARLGPLLSPELLRKALSMAGEIEDGHVTAVVGLAKYLEEPARSDQIRRALASAATAHAGIGLVKVMSAMTESLIPEAMAVLDAVDATLVRSEARVALAVRAGEFGHFETALDLIQELRGNEADARAPAIEALAPSVPEPLLPRVLLLCDMTPSHFGHARCRCLAAVAPRLPKAARLTALNAAIAYALRPAREDLQKELWLGLVPALLTLESSDLHPLWCETWRALAKRTRPCLLSHVYALRAVLAKVGGREGVRMAYRAVNAAAEVWS